MASPRPRGEGPRLRGDFLEDPTGLFGGHAVDLSLGSSETSAAVDLLVSKSGEWHVWAGQNPKNKSGSPISGRVLWAKNDVWLMVGGQGLSGLDLDVGGRQKLAVGGCIWELLRLGLRRVRVRARDERLAGHDAAEGRSLDATLAFDMDFSCGVAG